MGKPRPIKIILRTRPLRRKGARSRWVRIREWDIPTWLNTIFTLALAIFAYEAWTESQRASAIFQGQLTAAQEQIVAARDAQRAWLTVDLEVTSKFRDFHQFGFGGYELPISYKVKNIGHLPAQAVLNGISWVIPHVPAGDVPLIELLAQQKRACTRPNKNDPYGPTPRGSTMFPDETSESTDFVRMRRESWPTATFASDSYLYLIGCVIYRSGADDKDHHTAFAFRLQPKDGGTFAFPTDPTSIEREKTQLSRLRFSELLFAD